MTSRGDAAPSEPAEDSGASPLEVLEAEAKSRYRRKLRESRRAYALGGDPALDAEAARLDAMVEEERDDPVVLYTLLDRRRDIAIIRGESKLSLSRLDRDCAEAARAARSIAALSRIPDLAGRLSDDLTR